MEVDLQTMQEIKEYLVEKLQGKYGYCGIAEGEKMLMLNSGNSNLIIQIEVKE